MLLRTQPPPRVSQNLAESLFGSELAYSFAEPELPVAQLVLEQVLTSLKALHSSGLVHRDVKPLNLVLSEREKAFKLIDLGACADLRTGRNYAPDETILDPKYSPPEEFIMPIDAAPDLAKAAGPVALALGAASWARYQPDRFDTYSAGIVFMQARRRARMALSCYCSLFALRCRGVKWMTGRAALIIRTTSVLSDLTAALLLAPLCHRGCRWRSRRFDPTRG